MDDDLRGLAARDDAGVPTPREHGRRDGLIDWLQGVAWTSGSEGGEIPDSAIDAAGALFRLKIEAIADALIARETARTPQPAAPDGSDAPTSCRGRDCGRETCSSCTAIRAWYQRMAGDDGPECAHPPRAGGACPSCAADHYRREADRELLAEIRRLVSNDTHERPAITPDRAPRPDGGDR